MPPIVPPIKCQGIKTKLIPTLKMVAGSSIEGRWIEPFCGSGVVAFNLRPRRALLADTNQHIIDFYKAIQDGSIHAARVSQFLETEGGKLQAGGEAYYYEVRERFNRQHSPLDFLFLNRACFNGVMRFNRKGGFNVPFCRKPQRFAPAYITKIANQVRAVSDTLRMRQWTFQVADFRSTLCQAEAGDVVYADPPYMGRHVDYFNTWTEPDERTLIESLKRLPCKFILSTWQENEFRRNPAIDEHWQAEGLQILSVAHFYHVGASEDLRHGMMEAVVTNEATSIPATRKTIATQLALIEDDRGFEPAGDGGEHGSGDRA